MSISKIIDPNMAIGAYAKGANAGANIAAGIGGDKNEVKFSDFLRVKAQDSIEMMRAGEQMSAKAVAGEADLMDVVQAVTNAEMTLQTVVSIRDRLVSAYQEIMRMPI